MVTLFGKGHIDRHIFKTRDIPPQRQPIHFNQMEHICREI